MKFIALFTCPLLLACASINPYASDEGEPDAPDRPTITQVDRGTKIDEIDSDAYELGEIEIEDDVLKIEVRYAGGAEEHLFALYWNGIMLRSYPGQIHVFLKHDAQDDMAEAYLTRTLEFDLTTLNKPVVIHIHGNDGDPITVQYGEH